MQSVFISCNGLLNPDETEEKEVTTESDNEENIEEAIENNATEHDDPADYVWESSDIISIALNGNSVDENSEGVSFTAGQIVISGAGTYGFSGVLTNGQIVVNTEDEGIVRLIFNGVSITSSASAPVYVKKASKVLIYLEENSTNTLTDGTLFSFDNVEEEEPNAAIFSKSNLTLCGKGTLTVNANFNDAINSKDGLIISGGTYVLKAADDGIRGKDYLEIKSGNLTITAGGDGLKSDNETDENLGYIFINDGNFNIESKGDAIAAQTDVLIKTGDFALKSGGGSTASVSATLSAKGIKAGVNIIIDEGTFAVNSADDAVHSNETITINNGNFTLASADDGIHADSDLRINDGDINITKSYEGIESSKRNIFLNKGTVRLVSSDDGINLAGGGDSMPPPGQWGGTTSTSTGNYTMHINGGYIFVNANGDGLDANGAIEMTGGTVIVCGPTNNGNGALDYDSSFNLTGGFLVAAGSSGMAQAPGSSSQQYAVLTNFSSSKQAGTLVNIQAADGTNLLTFKPLKLYQSVVFSSPELKKGETYTIYVGGSSTGIATDGLFSGGTYSAGTKYASFTISGIITSVR